MKLIERSKAGSIRIESATGAYHRPAIGWVIRLGRHVIVISHYTTRDKL